MALLRGVVASLLLTGSPALAARTATSSTHVQHAHPNLKPASARTRDASPRRQAAVHRRGRAYARLTTTDDDGNLLDTNADVAVAASPADTDGAIIARGTASWYDTRGNGLRTSSGERFDENALTAAHSSLPLGTRVRVTVEGTNASVIVTINDRPGTHRRIIDLSKGAARELGILGRGVATVTLARI